MSEYMKLAYENDQSHLLHEHSEQFQSLEALYKYAFDNIHKFKHTYVIIYENDIEVPVHGSPFTLLIDNYYLTESGTYTEEIFEDLDQGFGVLEGKLLNVCYDLLPDELKDDSDLVCEAIDKFINSAFTTRLPKPIWLK